MGWKIHEAVASRAPSFILLLGWGLMHDLNHATSLPLAMAQMIQRLCWLQLPLSLPSPACLPSHTGMPAWLWSSVAMVAFMQTVCTLLQSVYWCVESGPTGLLVSSRSIMKGCPAAVPVTILMQLNRAVFRYFLKHRLKLVYHSFLHSSLHPPQAAC